MIAVLMPLFDTLVLIPFARLRMQRRARAFAILRLVAIVINVSLNVVFVVVMGLRIEGVLWAGAASSAATFLLFLPQINLKRGEGGSGLLGRMLRFGLPTVPASFSSILVLMSDRTVMLMLTSSATLGLYQTNFRLALPLMMFVTVFEYAWKPFYLQHRDDPDAKQLFSRVLTLFTVVCGVIFLVTALYMPYVVRLPFIGGRFINPDYWVGLSIVPIVMFAYYFNGVFVNLSAGLHITMRTGWFPVATGVAAVLSVVSMLVLVRLYGIHGAAWSKVVAYVGSVVMLAVYLPRVYPIKYDLVRITVAVASAAAVYLLASVPDAMSATGIIIRISAFPVFILLLFALGILQRSTIQTLLALVKR
jgi:O-antigen/teichoic acid export membrane protein